MDGGILEQRVHGQDSETDLAKSISAAMADVRLALGEILEHFGQIKRPADLQRKLQLDPALAWGVFRAAAAKSLLEASLHVPGQGSMRTFFRVAQASGVPAETVQRGEVAFEMFSAIREKHGGLQNGFAALVSDIGEIDSSKQDLKQRRIAFRANGHIWGIQTESLLNAKIFIPGQDGEIDRVNLQQVRELKRLRRSKDIRIKFTSPATPDRALGVDPARRLPRAVEALDCGDGSPLRGSGLLTDFCSRPLPDAQFESPSPAAWSTTIEPRDAGAGSTMTFTVGYCERGYRRRDDEFNDLEMSAITTIPAERLVYDVLVHKDLCRSIAGRVRYYGVRSGSPGAFRYQDKHLLPLQLQSDAYSSMGHAPSETALPDYSKMLDAVLGSQGHRSADFRMFRATVLYPILHAFARVQVSVMRDGPER